MINFKQQMNHKLFFQVISYRVIMGCTNSDTEWQPSILVRNVSDKDKEKLSQVIEENNVIALALIMKNIQAYPNSQVSQAKMGWMLTHLCCRWDSDFCLEFLLRFYFVENPKGYINLVNSQTIQGYTCLHLCCIWNSIKCFKVLNSFGGIYLQIKDNKLKTAYENATEYKCTQISSFLRQYKNLNTQFIFIQVERLVEGPLIPQKFQVSQQRRLFQKYKFQIRKQLYDKGQETIVETEHQKNLLFKKSEVQCELDKLFEEKLKKQLDYDVKRALILLYIQVEQLDKEEYEKIEKEKLVIQMEKERSVMQSQIQVKDQLLKLINNEIRKVNKQKFQKIKTQSNAKTEMLFTKLNLQLANKIKEMQKNLMNYKYVQNEPKNRQSLKTERKSLNTQQMNNKIPELPQYIQKLYSQAKKEGEFFDKQFPAQNSSIGESDKSKYSIFTQNTIWLRPRQFFRSQFKLFDGINPDDIKQGSLGVCYMLATLSALAVNPKNIKQIFVFYDLDIGFYVLKLYVNGVPKYFIVDDLIPCSKTTKSPLFTQPIGKQIWVLLLEKAWVKLIGDYLSAQSMTPDHLMEDLSGAPGYGWWLNKQNAKTPTEKIKEIVKHCSLGHIVVITSVADNKLDGIVNNHAYSLLQVYQYNNRYIFKVRNPWGQFQWNGQFGEKSSLCSEQFRKKVGYENKQDGIFYISQNQLLTAFCFYSISHIKANYHYSFSQFKSKKQENIYYRFSLPQSGDVNIRITQPFDRMLKDKNYRYSPMVFEIGKILEDQTVQFISEGHHRSYFGAKSVHAFQDIFQYLSKGQYFVRIRMIWHNDQKYNSAVIGVYATQPTLLLRVSQKQGLSLLKCLFYSFSKSFPLNRAPNGCYKICTMKGQFLFIAQTSYQGEIRVNFKFTDTRMIKTETDICKVSKNELETIINKNKLGVCTCKRIDPAQGGTTGPVSITFTKISQQN